MVCINSDVCVGNPREKLYYCNYLPALKPTAFVTIFCLSNSLRMWWQVTESLATCLLSLPLPSVIQYKNAPELPGFICQGNNVFSIALHPEYLQIQMNFQGGHRGLHSGSIRNESLINVRNEHFRWNSVGHQAQFAREGWTKSLVFEAGEVQGENGIYALTKVVLLILQPLSSHPNSPGCCPGPLEGWKTAPEQNQFIPNPPLEQFNGKWGAHGEFELAATSP